MEISWNKSSPAWEFDAKDNMFFRTMRIDYDDGSGGLIKVHLKPATSYKGKTDLIFYTMMSGHLHVCLTQNYTEVMVSDMEFFAPYIAFFEMKNWLWNQKHR